MDLYSGVFPSRYITIYLWYIYIYIHFISFFNPLFFFFFPPPSSLLSGTLLLVVIYGVTSPGWILVCTVTLNVFGETIPCFLILFIISFDISRFKSTPDMILAEKGGEPDEEGEWWKEGREMDADDEEDPEEDLSLSGSDDEEDGFLSSESTNESTPICSPVVGRREK